MPNSASPHSAGCSSAHPHPNLLSLRGVLPPPEGHLAQWRHLYLVTELYDTDLHQLIKSDQALSDAHCRFFVWQLLRGLQKREAAGRSHTWHLC